jgi:hypothetical protein
MERTYSLSEIPNPGDLPDKPQYASVGMLG